MKSKKFNVSEIVVSLISWCHFQSKTKILNVTKRDLPRWAELLTCGFPWQAFEVDYRLACWLIAGEVK